MKLRVLLVDDDDLVRSALKAGLKRMGYHVETADSGAAALTLVNATAENFDVLITDQMMPGMTGIELGERIGLIRSTMRRILITGYAAGWNEPKVKALGFAAMIMKPITMEHLNFVLKAACSKQGNEGCSPRQFVVRDSEDRTASEACTG